MRSFKSNLFNWDFLLNFTCEARDKINSGSQIFRIFQDLMLGHVHFWSYAIESKNVRVTSHLFDSVFLKHATLSHCDNHNQEVLLSVWTLLFLFWICIDIDFVLFMLIAYFWGSNSLILNFLVFQNFQYSLDWWTIIYKHIKVVWLIFSFDRKWSHLYTDFGLQCSVMVTFTWEMVLMALLVPGILPCLLFSFEMCPWQWVARINEYRFQLPRCAFMLELFSLMSSM